MFVRLRNRTYWMDFERATPHGWQFQLAIEALQQLHAVRDAAVQSRV